MKNKGLLYNYDKEDKMSDVMRASGNKLYVCGRPYIKDTRNHITTRDFYFGDPEGYCNYLRRVLESPRTSYGYLDLGMIPIIMAPPILHPVIQSILLGKLSKAKLDVYPLPAKSMCSAFDPKNITDYWMFREDAAKFVGKDLLKVTSEDVIRKVWV